LDSEKYGFSFIDRLNKLFEDSQTAGKGRVSSVWMPIVDIYETGREFIVKAELPEVNEKDINILMEGNTLKISGKRRFFCEGRNYHQVERFYGAFSRQFILPAEVDRNNISAALADGILTITLPKKAVDLPRHIEIE
jgi:HSP20 family protein